MSINSSHSWDEAAIGFLDKSVLAGQQAPLWPLGNAI